MNQYYVYILSNKRNGTLYIGVTNNLLREILKHKNEEHDGFTKKYEFKKLVYFKLTDDITAALEREKQLKNGIGLGN
jgi:putative endonuclease